MYIQLSDTTGTSNGTGFYGQMKQKKNDAYKMLIFDEAKVSIQIKKKMILNVILWLQINRNRLDWK